MSNPSDSMLNAQLAAAATGGAGEREESLALIARAVRGEAGAARALYDQHAPRVYRLAYRMCGDRDLAADMVQDVFVRVFARLDRFRGEAAFTTWLHRVAVTTCLNTLRKVKRFQHREVALERADAGGGESVPGDPVLRAALERAIDGLPPPLRIALVMYAIEGYTHGEVAAALGIAEGTSKSRVFEARSRLREALLGYLEESHDG
ncbi:MAG: RNA polymerase sigma factor [Gemmatimonadales bacterium]